MAPMKTAIHRCSGSAAIHLSFDDGPDINWTPRLLDLLAEARVTATFFIVGRCAMAAPDLVRRIAGQGHVIGNHTLAHRHPWFTSAKNVRDDMLDGAHAIADILGEPTHLYRPPHGCMRECMSEAAHDCKQHIVLWSISTRDWGMTSSTANIYKRLRRATGGDIVLLHDGKNSANRPDRSYDALRRYFSSSAGEHSAFAPITPALIAASSGQ